MPFSDWQIDALNAPLAESQVEWVPGQGNRLDPYISVGNAYANANRIFGFGAWGDEILDVQVGKAGVFARVRLVVTTPDGEAIPREDEGFGEINPNNPNKARAIETARKGAVSDAKKRCLRTFGNQFGNDFSGFSPPHVDNRGRQAPPPPQGGYQNAPPPPAQGQGSAQGNKPACPVRIAPDCWQTVGFRSDGTPYDACGPCSRMKAQNAPPPNEPPPPPPPPADEYEDGLPW